tara:strand:+ start:354 stop:905 length:552 start_codon:yes stop_codon:yes gene_type:complete
MDQKKLFIGIPVDDFIIKKIFKKLYNLNLPWEKIKIIKKENIHITLKFLGDTPLEKIPIIINSLEEIPKNFNNFVLKLEKTSIFNKNNPRTLILKFKENKELIKLYNKIEEILFENGISNKEQRKFKPHITIARIRKKSKFVEFKDYLNWKIEGNSEVFYLELIESELTKTGPEYTVLQTFDL